jgi:UDP-glucose 4-epimerase
MSNAVYMITGGSGFIGSHLAEKLLEEGNEVHIFDTTPLEKAHNLAAVKNHPGFRYCEGDIRSKAALESFWRPEARAVFHLASVVGIKNYIADPLKLIDIGVVGTKNLLEAAREYGTRVVFSSTSEIFGKNPAVPWDEKGDRVLGPTSVDRWSYSSSKAVCEHMLYAIHRSSGLPFSIVRFFNAYGPRQNPYFVVSQSVYKALRNEQPFLYDDGKMTRCFTYVEDIVRGVLEVAVNPLAVGEDFNLGNSVEVSMKEVVETILKEAGSKAGYKIFDTQKEYGDRYEDIQRRIPKVEKAEKLLGWKAKIQLDEGVRRTIEWARNNPWWLEDAKKD